MSKYEPLWKYIKDNKKDEYRLTYEEIKNIYERKNNFNSKKIKRRINEKEY